LQFLMGAVIATFGLMQPCAMEFSLFPWVRETYFVATVDGNKNWPMQSCFLLSSRYDYIA
jgi:hypothetical protein